MKTVLVSQKRVDDVVGLYHDLIKNDFDVENVGVDQTGTHVFLQDQEEKDPTPIVEAWVGKPAPAPTRSLVEQRKTQTGETQAKRAEKEAQRKAKTAAAGMAEPVPALLAPEAPKPQKLFAKIFRKLW